MIELQLSVTELVALVNYLTERLDDERWSFNVPEDEDEDVKDYTVRSAEHALARVERVAAIIASVTGVEPDFSERSAAVATLRERCERQLAAQRAAAEDGIAYEAGMRVVES